MSSPPFPSNSPLLSLSATATELAVRGMIDAVRDALCDAGVDDDTRGSVTLAVGEALNNVAEHAYAGRPVGAIHLRMHMLPDTIHVMLEDEGKAMPGGTLPPGRLPDASGPVDNLPEGGFGWFLIHDLSHSLSYSRKGGTNTLCMNFARPRPAHAASKP